MPEPPVFNKPIGMQKREVNDIEQQNMQLLGESEEELPQIQPKRPRPKLVQHHINNHHKAMHETNKIIKNSHPREELLHPAFAPKERIQPMRTFPPRVEMQEHIEPFSKLKEFQKERIQMQQSIKRPASVFIESHNYSSMLKDFDSISKNMSVIESRYKSILDLKNNEDSHLIELSKNCEDLQKKLLFVDRIIFER